MALMTTAEAKSILGLTVSTYDTQIAFFLPIVEKDIIDYIGHAFQDGYVYRESGASLAILKGDSDTADRITDTEGLFLDKGFTDGMDILIEGGYSNVGKYNISSASTDMLKMSTYGNFIDQIQNDTKEDNEIGSIRISRVKWPTAIKIPASQMVWYLIKNAQADDVQSESLDDYSISYVGSNAYPTRVINSLDKYRRPVFA